MESVKELRGIFDLLYSMSDQTLASLSASLSFTSVPLVLNGFLTLAYFLLCLQDAAQESSSQDFLTLPRPGCNRTPYVTICDFVSFPQDCEHYEGRDCLILLCIPRTKYGGGQRKGPQQTFTAWVDVSSL